MDAAPEFFSDAKNGDHFAIDDLLDFPSDDVLEAGGVGEEAVTAGTSTDSSTVTAVDTSCNSSFSAAETLSSPRAGGHFSGELCLPYDELAELEWLSNFVEESFSSEDLQKLELIQGIKARNDEARFQPEATQSGPMFRPEMPVPGKARSKRSRAAPGNWSSRLHMLSLPPSAAAPAMSSSSESDVTTTKTVVKLKKRAEGPDRGRSHMQVTSSGSASGPDSGEGRKCLHCATDKTPQWRTGPMGPKTLCNACGVRYKSGRLVPEYRPASSPSFVLTKHSNSHRKVLELRRQKGLPRAPPTPPPPPPFLHQNVIFDVSNGDDYLIHQHIGLDFRQLI